MTIDSVVSSSIVSTNSRAGAVSRVDLDQAQREIAHLVDQAPGSRLEQPTRPMSTAPCAPPVPPSTGQLADRLDPP